MTVPLAVTTSGQPLPELEAGARARALAWGLPFHPRRAKTPLAFGDLCQRLSHSIQRGGKIWEAYQGQKQPYDPVDVVVREQRN